MTSSAYHFDSQPSAQGAQGTVTFGIRVADGLPVAIKVASGGRGSVEALKQEIAVLGALARAGVGGVVPCIDILDVDGRPGMVMPRYPRHLGDWLNQALASPGPSTLRQALHYASAVAYTLGRVHQTPWQGGTLVHRDIKPENVFVDGHGAPWVGDFGGAMAIGGLERVELGLFGTPMWAPLDQILPGQVIPDPTWDTYALCVFLYAAISGARPAYQSDPRTLLTTAGRDLWDVARKAVEGPEAERAQWAKHFARMRTGAKASDLVDVTGHGALVDADRAVLDQGLRRLADAAGLSDRARRAVARSLWDVLVRGLSPVSHPSPPNRFRNGIELGELLDEIRDHVREGPQTPAPAPARPVAPPNHPVLNPSLGGGHEVPRSTLSAGPGPLLLLPLAAVAGAVLCGAGFVWREPLMDLALGLSEAPARAPIPAGTASLADGTTQEVPAFSIAGLETTTAAWQACVAAGACTANAQRPEPELPAVALSLADAQAYCAWAGGRVPTEAEWIRAAGMGPAPWGDAPPTCDHAIALGCSDGLRPVGSTAAGRTPEGVRDLAGNAWEWATNADGGVLLGGDLRSPARALGRNGRQPVPDGSARPTAGVRCVWSP